MQPNLAYHRISRAIATLFQTIGVLTCLLSLIRWAFAGQVNALLLVDVLAPWLVLGLLPLALISMLMGWRTTSGLLLTGALLLVLPLAHLFLPRLTPPPQTNATLTVMSYNLWYNNPAPDYGAMARLIRQEQPDILLLQETDAAMLTELLAKLEGMYGARPIYHDLMADRLQATISRYPLTRQSHPADKARLQKLSVETEHGQVTLLNVHAFRANFLPFDNPLSYGDNLTAHAQYEGQLAWLVNEINTIVGPLILGGDLNVPYQSADYRAIPLIDSHAQVGWGLGFTFPASTAHTRYLALFGRGYDLASPMRLVRLDYLFHSSHFVSLTSHTLPDSAGSDHAPIVATLGWR